jgi:hypothetical protein
MAMFTLRKKKVALVTVALVLVGGGMAYAYWTGDGAGTGTAGTGTSSDITAHQTSTVTGMGPGIAAQNLSGNFDNPNTVATYVGSVTASIGTITGGPTCEATDYTITNAVSTVGVDVPVGDGVGSWGVTDTPTIQFNNKVGENQDDCKDAVVAIVYTVG